MYGCFVFVFLYVIPLSAFAAVKFDLVPPSGQLSRGQDVTFTINIDTQGASVSTIQTGMTYETQYLEYVSAQAGATMNSVTVDPSQGAGKLVLTGTNASGYTGTGVFATVVFKIIATESGTTELCALWEITPSPTPTTPPVGPTTPPVIPTTPPPPPPTALPQSGFEVPKNTALIAGGVFLLVAISVFLYSQKNTYTSQAHHSHTHKKN